MAMTTDRSKLISPMASRAEPIANMSSTIVRLAFDVLSDDCGDVREQIPYAACERVFWIIERHRGCERRRGQLATVQVGITSEVVTAIIGNLDADILTD
jgi:hypothetical protein